MLVSLALTVFTLAAPADVPALAHDALAGDASAVGKLRALGQPGLDALVKLRQELSSVPPLTFGPPTPKVQQWEDLVDKVARQRYASASGLYWYTDLSEALARARAENKPVLSLRLLGDLDEDFSCANSRFFRTILYPDPAIAKALHDGWVLHWESVRKAPKITIDFGDGRTLVRTITGNSLHYALTPDGDVLDVMPGLVSPAAFDAWLTASASATREVMGMSLAARKGAIARRQAQDLARRLSDWHAALKKAGVSVRRDVAAMSQAMSEAVLDRLAADKPVTISAEAGELVRWMMPEGRLAREAMPLAVTKMVVERPMLRLLDPVAQNVARDEVRNQLEMKSRILTIALEGPRDLATLTQAIYARAFMTPLDDPWMGLAPADAFTGLPSSLERPKGP